MAESDLHRDEMFRAIYTLRDAVAGHEDWYVSGNLLLYYDEGNPRASVAPDVFLVKGVAKKLRPIYLLWEGGRPSVTVIEVTSKSTRREDQAKKCGLYARLGVREYFLYDPLGEYLRPALQGYVLDGGDYRAIAADAAGGLISEELGMRLVLDDGRLRFIDLITGVTLLSPQERAAAEAAARATAEARVAQLEALLRQHDTR